MRRANRPTGCGTLFTASERAACKARPYRSIRACRRVAPPCCILHRAWQRLSHASPASRWGGQAVRARDARLHEHAGILQCRRAMQHRRLDRLQEADSRWQVRRRTRGCQEAGTLCCVRTCLRHPGDVQRRAVACGVQRASVQRCMLFAILSVRSRTARKSLTSTWTKDCWTARWPCVDSSI